MANIKSISIYVNSASQIDVGSRSRSSTSSDSETNEPGPSSRPTNRSRPNKRAKLSESRPRTQNDRPTGSRSRAATKEWKLVTNGDEVHFSSYRFQPARNSGVHVPLNQESTPLDCFKVFFDEVIKDKFKNSVNEFANRKVQMNTPARKYSVYSSWEPITDSEIYKFLAVLIQMGLDSKPQIRDYWDTSDKGYSKWYSQMFDRNRFQSIFHTMLHCSDEGAEGKEKVEPFVNMMLEVVWHCGTESVKLTFGLSVVQVKGRRPVVTVLVWLSYSLQVWRYCYCLLKVYCLFIYFIVLVQPFL